MKSFQKVRLITKTIEFEEKLNKVLAEKDIIELSNITI
jgi:hypothetical protein